MYTIPGGYTLFEQDLDHVLRHAESAFDKLRGARLFITGGTGFFGIWLLESLLWANQKRALGLELTVLTRSPERFLQRAPHLKAREGLSFLQGGLADFDAGKGSYTHIIHAASETNLEQSSDWAARHLDAALHGTRRLLDMAAAHRSEAVLLTTSGAVYSQMDGIVDDRCVEGPKGIADYASEKTVYGQAKRMMEIMAAVGAQTGGYRALTARCFCFAGPYLPLEGNYAMGNFMRDALAGKDIVISGDGTPLRSYLHAADLVVWLLTILSDGKSGVPYNVGGEQAVSIAELAHAVARLAGMPGRVQIKTPAVPGARPHAYLPSIARARKELDLDVRIGLDDAIARTLAWHNFRKG